MDNFDIGDLPFSYITAENDRTYVIPGMNLFTVGTVRDGAKWPARDRRKSSVKRDLIVFDVLSPYTVGRMINGEKFCDKLYAETPKEVEEVNCGGAIVRRRILRAGKKNYAAGIEVYLLDKVFARIEKALTSAKSLKDVCAALDVDSGAVYDERWVDISGLLVAYKRFDDVEKAIESGSINTLEKVADALKGVCDAYPKDEWAWVCRAYEQRFSKAPGALSGEELSAVADSWLEVKQKFIRAVLSDAEKEFSEISRIGFGADGPPEAREADFQAVRGTYESDKFVKQLGADMEAVAGRAAALKSKLAQLS
jgi:hypothetical protein